MNNFFEIECDWKEMTCQMGITGSELIVRIDSDSKVDKEFIVSNLLKKIDTELYSEGDDYTIVHYDGGNNEHYPKTEVEEVVRRKVNKNGLNKRGNNYQMKFSIKFDNQGWWPDDA